MNNKYILFLKEFKGIGIFDLVNFILVDLKKGINKIIVIKKCKILLFMMFIF